MAPYLVALVPTIALLWLVGAFRFAQPRTKALWVAAAFGALATAPVWVVETVVEGPAASITGIYQRAFVQQVLGAAVVEELAILLAFLLAYLLFRKSMIPGPYDVVALAVATAIGFTTVENLLAVFASESPMSAAVSRLLSLFAGHATLQLIMGYFAAQASFGSGSRWVSLVLMLVAPIAVHGWGDFSEAVFSAYAVIDPDGAGAKNWFTAWIFALFAYIAFAAALLWQMLYTWGNERWASSANP